jgi:glycosyltransferase involved in cell wall biosynthesis
MRILNLCVETDQIMGGRGEMNVEVMPRLQALGNQVHWVSLSETWTNKPLFETSCPRERWPFVCGDQAAVAAQVLHATIMHCIKLGNRFDVILAHDWDMMFPAQELAKLWRIPWVACFHLFQHEMASVEGRSSDDPSIMPIAFEWNAISQASRVTCVSHAMARYAQKNMVDRHIDVVHNGVQQIANASFRPITGKPKLLYMGRIATQKGAQFVCDLAENTDEFDITFCGKHAALEVEDAEATAEMKRIRELEKLPHFHYHGWVSREDRHKFYEDCDMVVMPSLAEPFGIVGLEALAHGRPLLTTMVDGIGEFADGNNAWKISTDWRRIAEVARSVVTSGTLAEERSRNGIQTAASFNWDATALKYHRLIQEIVYGDFRAGHAAS